MNIKGFKAKDGTVYKYDYDALANKPAIPEGPGSGGNVNQGSGLTTEQITALDGMFKVCAYTEDATEAYKAFKTAFGIADSGGSEEPDVPDIPDTPDEPDEPEILLSGITAVYSGGDVDVGTAVADLTGIVVTAHFTDGSSETVTDYTLSGEIAEGENTVVVTYEGFTATFTVVGIAEEEEIVTNGWENGVAYELKCKPDTRIVNGEETTITGSMATDFLPCAGVTAIEWGANAPVGNYNAYYDADKNYLGNCYPKAKTVVDRNAAYIRFTLSSSKEYTATPMAYPMLDENTVWESGKYYTLPFIVGEAGEWWETEYMYIYGATGIAWRFAGYRSGDPNSRCILSFFDSEKNIIDTAVDSELADTEYTDIPTNAVYMKLSMQDRVGHNNGYIVLT